MRRVSRFVLVVVLVAGSVGVGAGRAAAEEPPSITMPIADPPPREAPSAPMGVEWCWDC